MHIMDSQQYFQPGTGAEPTSIIEISISCKNLLDKDVFSRSDPMCVVYAQPTGLTLWEEILRTETVWDNLDPEFTTKVVIDYRFEEEQKLRFELYDIDAPSKRLEDHDFLGFAECPLGRVVSSGYHGLTLPLSQNQNGPYMGNSTGLCEGMIILIAEELGQHKEEATIQLCGHSMGWTMLGFYSSRIFFTISKINETGKFVIVYKSKSSSGPKPSWAALTMPTGALCGGDHDRGLKVECFKKGINGYHKSLGSVQTSLTKMLAQRETVALPLTSSRGERTGSRLTVALCKLTPIFSFVEFIRGGTQLHAYFAIDMTGSNGDPNDPASLHHISNDTTRTNAYEQAVQSVGEIIKDYNTSQMFPAFGFGARVPETRLVSHNFNLNLENSSYMCRSIQDVLETYRRCIRRVQLWGPTNFAPIIKDVATMALHNGQNGRNYFVLLIITDGIISDIEATKEAIVNASSLPLSIIIVGVGGANFEAMEILDGDTVRISYNGRDAERDIVQFVPYRDAHTWLQSVGVRTTSTSHANTARLAKAKLAREVLAEVPVQLTSYMKSQNITPNSNLPPAPPYTPRVI